MMPDQASAPTAVGASVAKPAGFTVRDWLPWLFFGCGLLTMPVIFLLWFVSGHQSSHELLYEMPLKITGLCFCFLSPLFTRLPIWLRIVAGFVGLVLFAVIYAFCVVITMAIFGSGLPS
jgi:hypothetical protein